MAKPLGMRQRITESSEGTRIRYNRAQDRREDTINARRVAARIPPYAPDDGFDLTRLTRPRSS